MNASPSRLGLRELVDEHEDLVLRLKAERMWWQQLREMGKPNFGQMATRLNSLRVRLADHFSHEECTENEAVRSVGTEGFNTEEIATHHRGLLARLDAIIARLGGCGPSYDCWGSAGQEFELFAMDLQGDQEEELRRLRELLASS